MSVRSLSEAAQQDERIAAEANEAVLKRQVFEKYPAISVEANWPIIKSFVAYDGSALNEQNVSRAVDILTNQQPSSLAILSPADLQREQESMATEIAESRFRRKYRAGTKLAPANNADNRQFGGQLPSIGVRVGANQFGDFRESEKGAVEYYEIGKERYRQQLIRIPRETLKELVAAESQRTSIVSKIAQTYPPYDPNVISGGREAYEDHLKQETLLWMEKPIEELVAKDQTLRNWAQLGTSAQPGTPEYEAWRAQTAANIRESYLERHPEAVGASIPRTTEEAHQRDAAVANYRKDGRKVVIDYSRRELLEMPRGEYRQNFMKINPASGQWVYQSPEVEQAINDILNGVEHEKGQIRREFDRTTYVCGGLSGDRR